MPLDADAEAVPDALASIKVPDAVGQDKDVLIYERGPWMDAEAWMLECHWRMRHHLDEELRRIPTTEVEGGLHGRLIEVLDQRMSALEEDLRDRDEIQTKAVIKSLALTVGGEQSEGPKVLQTYTVSTSEVRQELDEWKPALKAEYNQLTAVTGAIKPIKMSELKSDPSLEKAELIPGKLVATIKAPDGKRKARLVICGNMVDPDGPGGKSESDGKVLKAQNYAGGVDATALRAVLRKSASKAWEIVTTDIRTAFLLAPRTRDERTLVVKPPKIMVESGICDNQELWLVQRALYGLTTSPADWAAFRDSELRKFEWQDGDDHFRLVPTREMNLWKIMRRSSTEKGSEEEMAGLCSVYVDDILTAGDKKITEGFIRRLQSQWVCSEPEWVSRTKWTRFCGLELRWSSDGSELHLAQPSYISEILKRHQIQRTRPLPFVKVDVDEAAEIVDAEDLKRAQALVGELLWLAIRSRPDISYAVSWMSQRLSKVPSLVVKKGMETLEYLAGTRDLGLVYGPCSADRGVHGDLPFARDMKHIELFADASFAPQGERSQQGILAYYGGCLIQWESSRQPFATLSTAESELVGYCEALVMGQSLESLLDTLEDGAWSAQKGSRVIYGDNQSAQSIIVNPDGPWRTRHLRLRSYVLREQVASKAWLVRHIEGTKLVADFLTKGVPSKQAWETFYSMASMKGYPRPESMESADSAGALSKLVGLVAGLGAFASLDHGPLRSIGLAALTLGTVASVVKLMGRPQGCYEPPLVDPGWREPRKPLGAIKKFQEPVGHQEAEAHQEPLGHQEAGAHQEPKGQEIDPGKLGSAAAKERAERHHCPSGCPNRYPSLRAMAVPQPEFFVESPWDFRDFEAPPSQHSDRWSLKWWSRGWLVREHGYRRVKAFQPLHGSLPVPASELSGDRVTLAFLDTKPREPHVHQDLWNLVGGATLSFVPHEEKWVGYTFIKRSPVNMNTPGPREDGGHVPRFGGAAQRAKDAGYVHLAGAATAELSSSSSHEVPRGSGEGKPKYKAPPPSLAQNLPKSSGGAVYVEQVTASGWTLKLELSTGGVGTSSEGTHPLPDHLEGVPLKQAPILGKSLAKKAHPVSEKSPGRKPPQSPPQGSRDPEALRVLEDEGSDDHDQWSVVDSPK